MPVLHRNAALRAAIRRGLPRKGVRLLYCRSVDRLHRVLQQEMVDAVVFDARAQGPGDALAIAAAFPRIPVFALSAFRPDDGRLMSQCRQGGVRGLFVEGVDDGIVGEVLAAHSASQARRAALENAPRLLRLTEPLQILAWNEVLACVGEPTGTADIARRLGVSREHLSREFAAGAAPNLKRVVDLARAVWAADLLANPGYTVRAVAAILRFSSPGHLAGCARRVAGVLPGDLAGLGLEGVVRRFLTGRTRSRL